MEAVMTNSEIPESDYGQGRSGPKMAKDQDTWITIFKWIIVPLVLIILLVPT